MHKIAKRSAAELEHQVFATELRNLSWDDLRVFVQCAKIGSFRKAASRLKLSSSTVVRRIERLERTLDARLFNRLPDGVSLTDHGRSILYAAQQMELASYDVVRKGTLAEQFKRTSVTISITEGLGSYWVMPKLVEYQRRSPSLLVHLYCGMKSADVLRLEADMAVQFIRPNVADLIIVKLGRLHLHPFAASSYLDIYGRPTSNKDIVNHRLIEQVAPQLEDQAVPRIFGVDNIDDIVGIRTNASTAHFYAIEKGAGIGILPSYAVALGAPVEPIDIGESHNLDIWLTYHPDVRKSPRKAEAIDWLKAIFNPKVYPWFRDEFIHPNELIDMVPPDADMNFGRGYFAATL